ncbi:hypothetical protein TNCV_535221 [Trichonephila clavipes]|nr:hypothetical protein TNCV_535221 [Trichonephila clavipes]
MITIRRVPIAQWIARRTFNPLVMDSNSALGGLLSENVISVLPCKKNVDELCNNYYTIPNIKEAELGASDEDLQLLEVRLESLDEVETDQAIQEPAELMYINQDIAKVNMRKVIDMKRLS